MSRTADGPAAEPPTGRPHGAPQPPGTPPPGDAPQPPGTPPPGDAPHPPDAPQPAAAAASSASGEPSFAARYRAAFRAYLASGARAQITPAYELSRDAVRGELSLLELADAHRDAVAEHVVGEPDPSRRALLATRAADFLRESLATFEIAHRGYREVQEVARIEHEHARQLQSVAEVSVALNAALPVPDVLELVTAEARHVLRARGARGHLELPGTQPRRVVTATAGELPAQARGPQARGPQPLRASLTGRRGLVLGEIEVFGARDAAAGAEAILVQLAQVASAAIGNAQLYGLEREIAETLQRSLLPQTLPHVDGLDIEARYCAAGDGMVVGGDFYDVFAAGDATLGIAIGDVCGKGPEAAALTALVRYTLRAAALWADSPERVMAMLNAAILEQSSERRFCTAIFGRLHQLPAGGARLDFVACGHPLPLVRRASGAVEAAGGHSTVLGVVPDPALELHSVALAPGDLLLLFTDGATEVRRRGREVFGMPQLRTLLGEAGEASAAHVAERVEDAVLGAAGGPPRDDLAVVAVRVPRAQR